MNSEEKAKELYQEFINRICEDNGLYVNYSTEICAKRCTLIAVDEIIQLRKGYFSCENSMNDEAYWQEVKNHLNNM